MEVTEVEGDEGGRRKNGEKERVRGRIEGDGKDGAKERVRGGIEGDGKEGKNGGEGEGERRNRR